MAYQSQLITIDDKDNDSNWQHNQSAWSITSFGAIPPWTRWLLAQITAGLNAGKWIRNGKAAALMCALVNVVNFAPIHRQHHLQFRRAQPNIICREHSFGIVDYVIDIQIPFPFMNGTFGCSSLIHFNCESSKLKDATQRNTTTKPTQKSILELLKNSRWYSAREWPRAMHTDYRTHRKCSHHRLRSLVHLFRSTRCLLCCYFGASIINIPLIFDAFFRQIFQQFRMSIMQLLWAHYFFVWIHCCFCPSFLFNSNVCVYRVIIDWLGRPLNVRPINCSIISASSLFHSTLPFAHSMHISSSSSAPPLEPFRKRFIIDPCKH